MSFKNVVTFIRVIIIILYYYNKTTKSNTNLDGFSGSILDFDGEPELPQERRGDICTF
mgnify:CR=1 FL=1